MLEPSVTPSHFSRLVVLFNSKLMSVSLRPLNQYPSSALACSEQQLQGFTLSTLRDLLQH
jgi:hypothetical protein